MFSAAIARDFFSCLWQDYFCSKVLIIVSVYFLAGGLPFSWLCADYAFGCRNLYLCHSVFRREVHSFRLWNCFFWLIFCSGWVSPQLRFYRFPTCLFQHPPPHPSTVRWTRHWFRLGPVSPLFPFCKTRDRVDCFLAVEVFISEIELFLFSFRRQMIFFHSFSKARIITNSMAFKIISQNIFRILNLQPAKCLQIIECAFCTTWFASS